MKPVVIHPGAPTGRRFRQSERLRYASLARRLDNEREHWERIRDEAEAQLAVITRSADAVADAVRRLDVADAAEGLR